MSKKIVMGDCLLCEEHTNLQEKCHIFPKFIVKKLMGKQAGNAPFLVSFPNGKEAVHQDVFARYQYCRKCENDIFNRNGERPVSLAYANPDAPKKIAPEILEQFVMGVCFRAAINQQIHKDAKLSEALQCWREALLSKTSPSDNFPVFVFVRNSRPEPGGEVLGQTLNYDIVEVRGTRVIWINMPLFILMGVVDDNDIVSFRAQMEQDTPQIFAETAFAQRNKLLALLPPNIPPRLQGMLAKRKPHEDNS